ncbi:MAG: hypothetical protein EOP19_33235 [Hyphomicrobiales bacterium]|nr:MAG: hypothetical protein EOP19_33235 [Hyphomicrobiales bacterium]
MAMVIGGGVVLLGLFLLFGKLWGGAEPAFAMAAKLFVPAWLVVVLLASWWLNQTTQVFARWSR